MSNEAIKNADSPRKRGPRKDAERNRERVMEAARRAVAQHGLDASYHHIAALAGVGVGTVYRRYPDRNDLLRAIVLDILVELTNLADKGRNNLDIWAGFSEFFSQLVLRFSQNAGLSDRLAERGGASVQKAREGLIFAIERLCERARTDGLRSEIAWHDIIYLANGAGARNCAFNIQIDPKQQAVAVDIILAGLRNYSP